MKYLGLVIFSLLSLNAFAEETININCTGAGMTTENQFDLVGTVYTDEEASAIGAFEYQIRAAGNDSEFEEGLVERNGSLKIYEAGTMVADKDVMHLQFVDMKSDLVYLSLVLNHPNPFSSRIRFKNGMVYKSKCTVTEAY